MKVAVVGGGPAGLYFALLLKKAAPRHDVVLIERNPPGATYGWGVVFSDRTLGSFREADIKSFKKITDHLIVWDAIDVRFRGEVIRCGGQAFSGIARKSLLGILDERCRELGVRMQHEHEVDESFDTEAFDLVVAADGVRSVVRDARSDHFRPRAVLGKSRYIWFGTSRTFDSFTFAFHDTAHGFFQAHAYPYSGSASTFIVECDEETWRSAGLDTADEGATISFCEGLFRDDLHGHPLMSNNSKWLQFVTIKNRRWSHGNVVLVGDSAHTAHFSIGSGTKLAMEDSIALANALETQDDVAAALVDYELERKPRVERFQEAAQQSQTYFENTRRYAHMEPLQFAFHLLSRSGRIDYDDLRVRDRHFVAAVDVWFARAAATGKGAPPSLAAPPAFTPAALGRLRVANRAALKVRAELPADEGRPPTGMLGEGAGSGAGLIFTPTVAVSEHARISPWCSGMWDDEHVTAWAHELQRARGEVPEPAFAVTLGHSGPRGSTQPRILGADLPLDSGGWTTVAASAMRYTSRTPEAVELDRARMREIVESFAAAAERSAAAGFDALELHMGHGYLLATFISPLTNRRGDGYGGAVENRLRYPLEVFDEVRRRWPAERPLGVALSASDWARGGLALEEAVATAALLGEHGCDFIRVLAGQTVARFQPRLDTYYFTRYADALRNRAGIATIATGPITTVDDVNTIVAGGRADLCLLRAPLTATSAA